MKAKLIIYSMFSFFVFCNVYAAIVISITGYLDASYPGYKVRSYRLIFESLTYIIVFYFYIFSLFALFSNLKNKISIGSANISRKYVLNFSVFILFIQLLFLYAIIFEGAGVAGGVENPNRTIISSIFAIFRVDDFVFMYLIAFGALFRANFILFFVNFILRGWLSVFICIILIAIARFNIKLKGLKFYLLLAFILILLSFMGVMLEVRNIYRLNSSLDLDSVFNVLSNIEFNITKVVLFSIHNILMRFQQVESLVYFMENKAVFELLYNKHLIPPVYFDGPVVSSLYSILFDVKPAPLGFHLADQSRELIVGRKTAMSPGLITYILLDYLTLLYVTFIPIFLGYISTFYKDKNFSIVMAYFLFIYFSFGWSNAVFGIIITSIVFVFCSLLIAKKVVITDVRKNKVYQV